MVGVRHKKASGREKKSAGAGDGYWTELQPVRAKRLRRKVFRFLCGDGENRSAGILSEAAGACGSRPSGCFPRQQTPSPFRVLLPSPRRNGTFSGSSGPQQPAPIRFHRVRLPVLADPGNCADFVAAQRPSAIPWRRVLRTRGHEPRANGQTDPAGPSGRADCTAALPSGTAPPACSHGSHRLE